MPTIPVIDDSLMTSKRLVAYYREYPLPMSQLDAFCPMVPNLTQGKPEDASWHVIRNSEGKKNLIAPGVNLNSEISARGRQGYDTISGNFYAIGDAEEKTKSDFGDYARLKAIFSQTNNPSVAAQLLKFWDDPLNNLRRYAYNFRLDASYKLISAAGEFKPDSPYYKCLTQGAYPIPTTQKVKTATDWSDPDAPILNDIETNFITLPKSLGMLPLKYILINAATFRHVQANNGLRKQIYARSFVNNEVTGLPSLEEINSLLMKYFNTSSGFLSNPEQDMAPQFIVVNDALLNSSGVAYNPFADGVAVGVRDPQWGHFEYVTLENNPKTQETSVDWLQFGMYEKETEVRYQKLYMRGFGYPVLDSYDENIYLKTNATNW